MEVVATKTGNKQMQYRCPNCQELTHRADYARLEIQHCPHCGGNWVDESTFRSIQERRETRVTGPDVPQMQPHEEKPIRCPRCNLELLKIPFMEGSDIIVDKCKSCQGYWFDVGELEAVQVVFRNVQDAARRRRADHRPALSGRRAGRRALAWAALAGLAALVTTIAVLAATN